MRAVRAAVVLAAAGVIAAGCGGGEPAVTAEPEPTAAPVTEAPATTTAAEDVGPLPYRVPDPEPAPDTAEPPGGETPAPGPETGGIDGEAPPADIASDTPDAIPEPVDSGEDLEGGDGNGEDLEGGDEDGEEPEPPAPSTQPPPEGPGTHSDEPQDVPEDQAEQRRQPAAVTLSAPVRLGTHPGLAALLCPPVDLLTLGGWESCGADLGNQNDYLSRDSIWRECYHPPVHLGVGDRYRWETTVDWGGAQNADGHVGFDLVLEGEILSFSAPQINHDGRWSYVQPRLSEISNFLWKNPDGTTEPGTLPEDGSAHVYLTPNKWIQIGDDPGNRSLADDGTLASGLLAVYPSLWYTPAC